MEILIIPQDDTGEDVDSPNVDCFESFPVELNQVHDEWLDIFLANVSKEFENGRIEKVVAR